MELPYHDPRAFVPMGVTYATAARGACHLESIAYWRGYGIEFPGWQEGPHDRLASPGAAAVTIAFQDYFGTYNPLGLCKFIGKTGLPPADVARFVGVATGWDITGDELLTTGARIFNLKRLINNRYGIRREDDTLPPRILTHPRPSGGAEGNLPDLPLILEEYYAIRGWLPDGTPSPETLRQLGLALTIRAGNYRHRRLTILKTCDHGIKMRWPLLRQSAEPAGSCSVSVHKIAISQGCGGKRDQKRPNPDRLMFAVCGLALMIALVLGLSADRSPAAAAPEEIAPATDDYVVLTWNDLGMHCYNRDFRYLAVLPPYNNLWAQVIRRGDPPVIVTDGVSVSYGFPDNTFSVGKSNFWQYDLPSVRRGLAAQRRPDRQGTERQYGPPAGQVLLRGRRDPPHRVPATAPTRPTRPIRLPTRINWRPSSCAAPPPIRC